MAFSGTEELQGHGDAADGWWPAQVSWRRLRDDEAAALSRRRWWSWVGIGFVALTWPFAASVILVSNLTYYLLELGTARLQRGRLRGADDLVPLETQVNVVIIPFVTTLGSVGVAYGFATMPEEGSWGWWYVLLALAGVLSLAVMVARELGKAAAGQAVTAWDPSTPAARALEFLGEAQRRPVTSWLPSLVGAGARHGETSGVGESTDIPMRSPWRDLRIAIKILLRRYRWLTLIGVAYGTAFIVVPPLTGSGLDWRTVLIGLAMALALPVSAVRIVAVVAYTHHCYAARAVVLLRRLDDEQARRKAVNARLLRRLARRADCSLRRKRCGATRG